MLVSGLIVVDNEISLKQLDYDDTEEFFELTKKNKEYLLPWFAWAEEMSVDITRKFIENSYSKNEKRKGCDLGIYYYGQLCGVIGLTNSDKEIKEQAEIAYWLSHDFKGKGIMIRAVEKIEEYCFEKLNFDTLYIFAFAENKASRTIPEKLGYNITDADMDPTSLNGKKSYYLYYEKTQSEYKSNFWNYLAVMFNKAKLIIETKKGQYSNYLGITCPVDLGYLKNDWEEHNQIDVFVGSDGGDRKIKSIICTVDFKNKFSDIKILYGCTSEETNMIFSLLAEKEGVLLVQNENLE